jgi:hypothetical protein
MFNIKTCSIIMLSIIIASSCERKEKETAEGPAGKGGNANIKIVSKHHGKDIDNTTVFIKYNTSDAANQYDDSVVAVHDLMGIPVATFEGLKQGSYYLYGRGWDTTISATVLGGLPLTISEDKTYEISLPVTEGD